MKANRKRYSANWTAFLGVLVAGCFLATAAQANPLFTGTFQLAHEVRWGQAVLGPGAYSLVLDNSAQTIIISDAGTGKPVARVFARSNYEGDRGESKLIVAVRGNQRAVSDVRLAGIGDVYQQAHPFAGAAQEARNAEAIPIEFARK
jgi:hypothetical protein